MIVLLDTNVFVTFMREPSEFQRFSGLVQSREWTVVFMSSVTLFELEIGVVGRQSETFARARQSAILSGPIQIKALDDRAALLGAGIAAKARSIGKQLSTADALIAGHAAALNARLVTDDARLAAAVSDIEVVSWR
jgi:predicted nucleic acid-binding protein